MANWIALHPVGPPAPVPASLPLNRATAEGACALDRRPFVGQLDNLPASDPLAPCADKLCLMPVEFGGQTLGTLAVTRPASAPAFTSGEVELLQAVADFIGIARATENLWQERTKRLGLEQEIQVAAAIQRSLLPASFPTGTRWSIHGACRPAREVGGDYFDVVALPDGGALLLVADVMGKGVPASLLAAMLRSALRALSALETSPHRLLTGINRQLFPDLENLGMFITAALVSLPADPALPATFANAGHCAPALLHPDGSLFEAPGGDVPLGVLPDTAYHPHPLPIGPRDRLVLYTDGCYELATPSGELLGADAFLRLAADRRALPPAAFVAALLDPAALQLDPAAITDDRTLLVASPSP